MNIYFVSSLRAHSVSFCLVASSTHEDSQAEAVDISFCNPIKQHFKDFFFTTKIKFIGKYVTLFKSYTDTFPFFR